MMTQIVTFLLFLQNDDSGSHIFTFLQNNDSGSHIVTFLQMMIGLVTFHPLTK